MGKHDPIGSGCNTSLIPRQAADAAGSRGRLVDRGATMNEVIRAILARRSVRAFRAESIKTEDLDAILECASYAPSAMNVQNWHFTAIRDGAVIDKLNGWIAAEIKESGNPYLQGILERSDGKVFRNAPCVIVVSTEKQDRFSIINASAATQNMLLAAHSLGIGSCWIGTVGMLSTSKRADEYASELRVPAGYVPSFGVTLGYSAASGLEAPPRKEGVTTII
jgi:nitroreductase